MTTQTAPHEFTSADITYSGGLPRIQCDRSQLIYNPPEWMQRGLQQTASGYGGKLNSGYSIRFNGKLRRVYVMCYSNSGTAYIKHDGKTLVIDAM